MMCVFTVDIPDAYVKAAIYTSPHGVQRTECITDDVNPVWNTTFKFFLDPQVENELGTLIDIIVKVKNELSMSIGIKVKVENELSTCTSIGNIVKVKKNLVLQLVLCKSRLKMKFVR